jgi:hypothetical protein
LDTADVTNTGHVLNDNVTLNKFAKKHMNGKQTNKQIQREATKNITHSDCNDMQTEQQNAAPKMVILVMIMKSIQGKQTN